MLKQQYSTHLRVSGQSGICCAQKAHYSWNIEHQKPPAKKKRVTKSPVYDKWFLTQLKSKASILKPVVRIGKAGITDNVVKEIKKQLEKKKLIKIKLLRSFVKGKNKKMVVRELAGKTNSMMVDMVGFTVVLYKKLK